MSTCINSDKFLYGDISYVEVGLVDERNLSKKTIMGPTYAYYDDETEMFIVETPRYKKHMFPREQVVSFTVVYEKEDGEENEV